MQRRLGLQQGPCIQRLYDNGAYGGGRARAIESAHALVVEVVRRPWC